MTKKRILILFGLIILAVNSCLAVAAAGAGVGIGYYCGSTSNCTKKGFGVSRLNDSGGKSGLHRARETVNGCWEKS